jgi:signal transduction histidine kinase
MNWWALLPLTGVVALSVVLLRRWPFLGLGLLLITSVALRELQVRLLVAAMLLPILLAGLGVCYIAATRPWMRSITAAVLTIGVQVYVIEGGSILIARLDARPASPLAISQMVSVALTMVVAWLAGYLIRQGHAHAEALRAQAQAQAASAERLRIARELHDIVAHSIGVIAIQAGMGSRVIDTRPAEARDALNAIETSSRETLSGLRRMLGALRRAEPGGRPGPAPLDPAPGLADLDRLASTTTDAGIRVDVQWRGQRLPVPADIDLSAYRIVQEAVANVVRHSGASHCRVLVDHRDEELVIEVTDDGRGEAVTDGGYGIAGMRERAGMLGGHFTAGPRPGGGFRVAARLPLPATSVGQLTGAH